MKVIRWIFKWGLIGFLALMTLVFVLISGGANPIINSQIKRIEQLISDDAQRPVKISHVDLRAFPSLVLEVDNFTLGEQEGSAWSAQREAVNEPLDFIEFKQIVFRFNVWRAIISLGQDLELEAMNVEGLHVTLHRDREGRWNFEDRAKRVEPPSPPLEPVDVEELKVELGSQLPQGPQPPQTPEERAREREELRRVLSSLKLSGVGVKDLKVRLIDEWGLEEGDAPRVITLAKVDLTFPRLELMDIIEGSFSASLFEDRENLTMSFKLGPLSALFDEGATQRAAELELSPFPIEVSLNADALSFEPLAPYLPADSLARLENLKLNGGLELKIDPKGEVKTGGSLSMSGLQVKERPDAPWGPEVNVTLQPELLVSLSQDLVDLNGFSLQLNEMALKISGQATELSSELPQLKGVSVKTEAVRLERLLSLAPPVRSQLPPGAQLAGPISLSVVTSGDQEAQQVDVLLDLTEADIQLPEQLSKPAGVPVRLALKAGVSPTRVQLSSLEAQLSDLVLSLSGVIQPTQGDVTLKGGVKPFSINKLVRLIPSVQAAIPPEVAIAGIGSLELDLQQRAQELQLDLSAGLDSCQLDTPDVKLIGSGQVKVKVQGDPSSSVSVSALSDLSGLAIKAGEAFDKPAGVPLDVKVQLAQSPSSLTISQLEAHLASLDLVGTGRETSEGFELNATLKPSPLGPLIALSPSAAMGVAPGLKQGRLGFNLKVKAGQGADDLSCSLEGFSLVTPKSDLKGRVSFKRPSKPEVSFDFSSSKLDLDELAPPSAAEEGSSQDEGSSSAEPSEAPELTLNGSVSIKAGQARGVGFKDLKAQLSMNGPKVQISTLQVDVFQGQVKAAPLQITLPSEEGSHFKGQLELKKVNIERALQELSSKPKKSIAGLLDAQLNLEGEGSEWEELSPTLHGEGQITLERGVLYGLDPEAAIVNELARKVPGVKKKRPAPLKLKTLKGAIEIKGGAVHLKEPIDLQTSEGPLRLEGALGLNLEADMQATLSLSPERLSKQLGKPVPQKDPIKVPFKVQGPLSDPKVSGVGLAAVVAVAAVALGGGEALKAAEALKGKGRRALSEGKRKAKRAIEDGKARATQALTERRQQASQQAEAAKKEAQAEADELKKKAQERAEQTKKDAEASKKAAKKAAKSKAGKAAKKLKGIF